MIDAVRSTLYWMVFWALSPLFVLGGLVCLLFGSAAGAHVFHVWWCRLMVFISPARLHVIHPERLNRTPPVIYVSNHESLFDVLIVGAVLKTQYRWLAKDSLFRIPILGRGMKRTGYIPIARENKDAGMKSLYRAAERVKAGISVFIFPEGTRTKTGKMLPFKQGAFILAKKAEVTIQPLTIHGTGACLPVQKGRWIQRIYRGDVFVTVHEAIAPERYGAMSAAELSDTVRNVIQSGLPGTQTVTTQGDQK
ncbi:MAG: 1-acyl-sn-glycerol-3-phosphate acyltransferase [Spirochaetia bacterium]|nr:1-acyl-sn-glycerol-3-phosphate acyltransferase [Spirochaetia bacterium]